MEDVSVCGDGRRLGPEECDDGNVDDYDGCSATCLVEPGFRCLGGCQTSGDPQRRYGECAADVCVPLPCGWDRMVTAELEVQGALSVAQPIFLEAQMGQSNPAPNTFNTLSLTLQINVPMSTCATVVENVMQPVSPWLQVTKEWTLCLPVKLTITGLAGASWPSGAISVQESTPNGLPLSYFGNTGTWDNMAKSLTLSVRRELPLLRRHMLQFTIRNPSAGQDSPPISLQGSGIVVLPQAVTKDLLGTTGIVGGRPGDAAPLKVYPLSGGRRRYDSAENSRGSERNSGVDSRADGDDAVALREDNRRHEEHEATRDDTSTHSHISQGSTKQEGISMRGQSSLSSSSPPPLSPSSLRDSESFHSGTESSVQLSSKSGPESSDELGSKGESVSRRRLLQQACDVAGAHTFCTKLLAQDRPFPGVTNTLTLLLKTNFDMAAGTLVTLRGLMPSGSPILFAITSKEGREIAS